MSRNLLAGLANSIWSALIGLAAVPFYLKYLGVEAYGLIGFYVTTQAVLGLLDMGMAPTINREVARCSASGNMQNAGRLLHTLAVVYWTVAGLIAVVIIGLAPWIADNWLQYKELSEQSITHAVMLMGLVLASRWPIGLYQGALFGAQRMTLASTINMVMVTVGSVGAIGVLAYLSPTIEAFFVWQVSIGVVYALTMRNVAWKTIGRPKNKLFDLRELKNIWKFSAGMSGITVATVIFMQLDKVILSKMLNLADYGHYMIAMLVSNGLLVLLTPVFNVIYPRMTLLIVNGDRVRLLNLYRSGANLLAAAIFPIALAAIVASKDLLFMWTGNITVATSVSPILSLLLVGTALNGIMIFPYALQLASASTKLPLTVVVVLISVHVPLTLTLVGTYGAMGGAIAWATLNVFYLFFGTWITHRKLLKGIGIRWLMHDIFLPLVLSLTLMITGWVAFRDESAHVYNVVLATGLALVAFLTIVGLLHRGKIADNWAKINR